MNFTIDLNFCAKQHNYDWAQWRGSAIVLFYDSDCLFSYFYILNSFLTHWDTAATSCKYCITPISPPQQSSGTFKALLQAQTKTRQANTEDMKERLRFCVTHSMAHLNL